MPIGWNPSAKLLPRQTKKKGKLQKTDFSSGIKEKVKSEELIFAVMWRVEAMNSDTRRPERLQLIPSPRWQAVAKKGHFEDKIYFLSFYFISLHLVSRWRRVFSRNFYITHRWPCTNLYWLDFSHMSQSIPIVFSWDTRSSWSSSSVKRMLRETSNLWPKPIRKIRQKRLKNKPSAREKR